MARAALLPVKTTINNTTPIQHINKQTNKSECCPAAFWPAGHTWREHSHCDFAVMQAVGVREHPIDLERVPLPFCCSTATLRSDVVNNASSQNAAAPGSAVLVVGERGVEAKSLVRYNKCQHLILKCLNAV